MEQCTFWLVDDLLYHLSQSCHKHIIKVQETCPAGFCDIIYGKNIAISTGEPMCVSLFDLSKNSCLVPVFSETDIDTYFQHIAIVLHWPHNALSIMLQLKLTGKAQEIYSALSVCWIKSLLWNAYLTNIWICTRTLQVAFQGSQKKILLNLLTLLERWEIFIWWY